MALMRNPKRPMPGLAGLGDNLNAGMGVGSSRGMAPQGAAFPDPASMAIPGVPDSLVTPDEPVASSLNLRKMIEDLRFPGLRAEDVEKFVKLFQAVNAESIQQALAHYSIYSQVKPFDNYDVYPIPIVAGAQAVRLDRASFDLRNRRALVVFNTSAADVLFVGKNERVNATTNMGIPVGANNGSYMVAAHERLPHFGFCVGATTAVVAQYS
jgi:hypothetical protein